jgi:hypothetical protein
MELGLDNITQLTLSNGTFDLNTIMVVPQNGSIQNLKISFDPAPLLSIVTEDYYEAVTWSVSVFTGVSYDTNPAIPIVRTAKLEIGRCKRVVPSFSVYVRLVTYGVEITISLTVYFFLFLFSFFFFSLTKPESANVFSYGNGAIGWRFRVQSWNNVFCGDVRFFWYHLATRITPDFFGIHRRHMLCQSAKSQRRSWSLKASLLLPADSA